MTGYISVHRKMMDSAIWSDPNYLKLWMYCLFKAGYKEREILLGNTMIKLSVGQFVTGRKVLTDEMNKGVKPEQKLSEKSWERYLKNLEKWEMLTIEVTNKFSVVTVVKYGVYQNKTDEVDQLVDQQVTNKCPTTDQQVTTNNKVNKVNKVKKEPSSPKFSTSDMENSKLLFEKMLENNPDIKQPNFEKWASDFRMIRERDQKTDVQIKYLINWTQNDEFWKSNILSPSKLRKQWDQLVIKAKAEKAKGQEQSVINKQPKAFDVNDYLRSE